VLLALCEHAAIHGDDAEYKAWPGVQRLADMCGLSGSNVRKHLDGLVKIGLVEKRHRKRRASGTLGGWLYVIPVDKLVDNRVDRTTTAHGRALVDERSPALIGERWSPYSNFETKLENPPAPSTLLHPSVDKSGGGGNAPPEKLTPATLAAHVAELELAQAVAVGTTVRSRQGFTDKIAERTRREQPTRIAWAIDQHTRGAAVGVPIPVAQLAAYVSTGNANNLSPVIAEIARMVESDP
jgi:hypothetical protein